MVTFWSCCEFARQERRHFRFSPFGWSDQFLCLENVDVASDKRSVWKWYLGRWIHRKKKQIFRFPVNHLADQALRGIHNSKYLQIQILWNISQLLSEVVSKLQPRLPRCCLLAVLADFHHSQLESEWSWIVFRFWSCRGAVIDKRALLTFSRISL